MMKAREFLPVIAIIALAGAGSALLPRVLPLVQSAENWLSDFRFGTLSPPEPQSQEIVVISITEDTLATLPYRSPIDRGFLSDLLSVLESAKPRAIGLDILLDQPTEAAKDNALQDRLSGLSVPLVVASAGRAQDLTDKQFSYLRSMTKGLTTGLVTLVKDRVDGTVRWILAGDIVDGRWIPGFAGALATAVGVTAPKQDVPLTYRGHPGDGTPSFQVHPAHTVKFLPKSWFAGKIVLIGADLPHADRHRTPFAAPFGSEAGKLPGVIVFAHALSQLLDRKTSAAMGATGQTVLIMVLAAVGMALAAFDTSLPAKIVLFTVALAVFWVGGFALYRYGGMMIPLLAPSISFAAGSSIGVTYFGRKERRQRKFIQDAFSRYLSPTIVRQLIADPSQLKIGGEKRELTYLFTDITDFTSLTECVEPSVLVTLLNEYLNGFCRILLEHGATIDKIIGDAVIGFFNAPLDQADHPARAVAAALELDAFSQEFVRQQAQKGLKFGITRIGVHSGEAIIGNFGADNFFDYTALGDMVNTAARLESVNRYLGTRICISASTAAECPDMAFRPVGSLVLKGKSKGIEALEPLAADRANSPEVAAYREAFEMMRRNDPAALEAFRDVVKLSPDDKLARFHLRRLENGKSGITVALEGK